MIARIDGHPDSRGHQQRRKNFRDRDSAHARAEMIQIHDCMIDRQALTAVDRNEEEECAALAAAAPTRGV